MIYLDADIFYQRYHLSPENSSKNTDWLFEQFTEKFPALISDWIKLELLQKVKCQATKDMIIKLAKIDKTKRQVKKDKMKKQVKEAAAIRINKVSRFIISELNQFDENKKVVFLTTTQSQIELLLCQNLGKNYSLHIATALHQATERKVKYFVTFDEYFQKEDAPIIILNPKTEQFKDQISQLKKVSEIYSV